MTNDITSTVTITQANMYLTSSGTNALDVLIVVLVMTAILVLFSLGYWLAVKVAPLRYQ